MGQNIVKLGILGAGICANNFHLPALKTLGDYYELVAMASGSIEQNKSYCEKTGISRSYTDYKDLINDPNVEAVIASYPYALNEELLRAAKAAGKHILVEKPIAENIEKGMRCAALDDGTIVMGVAENWLWWDVINVINEQLANGSIGNVHHMQLFSYYNMDLDSEYLRDNAWRRTATGGMILDRTIHTAALARAIFGPVARASGLNCGIREELGKTDTVSTLLVYESGLIGGILNSASAPGVGVEHNMIILGTKGTISVQDRFQKVVVTNHKGTQTFIADNGDGGYRSEFLDFHKAITEQVAFKSDLKSACNDLFTVLTALEYPGEWKDYKSLEQHCYD